MGPTDSVRVVKAGVSRNVLYPEFLTGVAEDVAQNAGEAVSSTTIFNNQTLGVDGVTLYFCNTTLDNIDIILPLAPTSRVNGKSTRFEFKRITTDSNIVTITPQGGNTIDGDTSIILTGVYYPSVAIASDGLEWYIIEA